jgi:hypothetical protein
MIEHELPENYTVDELETDTDIIVLYYLTNVVARYTKHTSMEAIVFDANEHKKNLDEESSPEEN